MNMLGVIIGDIVGSTGEWCNIKTKNFDTFIAMNKLSSRIYFAPLIRSLKRHLNCQTSSLHLPMMWQQVVLSVSMLLSRLPNRNNGMNVIVK